MIGLRLLLALSTVVCASVTTASQAPAAAPSKDARSELVLAPAIDAAGQLTRLHSLLVSLRGELIVERYYNGARSTRPANIKSASKSVISALVGIAIERGLITSVTQPITAYFPVAFRSEADAPKRQITIEHLLTMRSGLESTSGRSYGTWVRSRNWVRHILARPLQSAPGTEMDYSTGNTHLLSAIIAIASKQTTRQFAQQALARPLGFPLPEWPRDPQGVHFGGNDMLMTPRQMLAFGELYLNRGLVDGRQIVSAAWIDASFVPRVRSYWSDQLYGYGWWIRDVAHHRVYFAWGFGGQYIFIVPDLQLVVVTTSSTATDDERRGHRRTLQQTVEELVIGPLAALAATSPR